MSHAQAPGGDSTTASTLFNQRTDIFDLEQGVHSASIDHDLTTAEPQAPLLVKVTGYRILNTAVLLILGIWKSVATYRNEAILSTSLDLVLGVILAVM